MDVAADELDQRVVGLAIEVPRLYPVEPEHPGGLHPVGPVDHQAVGPVHEHWWPVPGQCNQPLDMLLVEPTLRGRRSSG